MRGRLWRTDLGKKRVEGDVKKSDRGPTHEKWNLIERRGMADPGS